MEVGIGPGNIALDGGPSYIPRKGHSSSPTFQPMSIVAKRSPISATVERALILLLPIAAKLLIG